MSGGAEELPPERDAAEAAGLGRRFLRGVLRFAATGAVAAVLAWVVMAYLVQTFRIVGGSMEPALRAGERVLVLKVGRPAERGEVVVFRDPLRGRNRLVKRVVGVPGDRVRSRDGAVLEMAAEMDGVFGGGRFRAEGTAAAAERPSAATGPPAASPDSVGSTPTELARSEVIEEAHYFVLGDNRSRSRDSRHWGPLSADAVVGRALLRVWPPDRFGRIAGFRAEGE